MVRPQRWRTQKHEALMVVLRATRLQKKLTQEELSLQLGRDKDFIMRIETGARHCKVVELFEIADVLGLDVQTLIERIKSW